MNNMYYKWNEFTGSEQYCLYMSEKQFFGRRVKNRLTKKWYHRYLRKRNKEICRRGLKDSAEYCIYFGRYVYTYYASEENPVCYTASPKQKGCRKVKRIRCPNLYFLSNKTHSHFVDRSTYFSPLNQTGNSL